MLSKNRKRCHDLKIAYGVKGKGVLLCSPDCMLESSFCDCWESIYVFLLSMSPDYFLQYVYLFAKEIDITFVVCVITTLRVMVLCISGLT